MGPYSWHQLSKICSPIFWDEISQAGCGGSHLQVQYSEVLGKETTELVEGQPGLHWVQD